MKLMKFDICEFLRDVSCLASFSVQISEAFAGGLERISRVVVIGYSEYFTFGVFYCPARRVLFLSLPILNRQWFVGGLIW